MVTASRATAPASIGNVAVGFDTLGLALADVGDQVVARKCDQPGVTMKPVEASDFARGAEKLSTEPTENTAGIATIELLRDVDAEFGVELTLRKGIPLGSGMGSSAASAVAATVAVNALLPKPLSIKSLLPYALAGEAFASKALHADNIAPSLFGGLVFCPPVELPTVWPLRLPAQLRSVVVHPGIRIDTAASRGALGADCSLAKSVEQQSLLAAFVLGCERGDQALIARSLRDVVVEPQRAPGIPGFDAAKRAALASGALGFSISGSGPSVFSLVGEREAVSVREAIEAAFRTEGLAPRSWVSRVDAPGATVEVIE